MKGKIIVLWLLMAATAFLFGCSLPEDVKKQAQQAKADVSVAETLLKGESANFGVWVKSPEAARFLGAVTREDWNKRYFKAAEASLKEASVQVTSEIEPVLKKDSRDDQQKLVAATQAVQRKVVSARKLLGEYKARRTAFEAFVAKQVELTAQAEASQKDVVGRVQAYSKAAEAASKQFPERQVDLASLVLAAVKLQGEGDAHLTNLKTEVKKSGPDYGAAIDALSGIAKVEKDVQSYTATQSKRLGELGSSYSKTLVDMRVDYFVTISRYSWDESSDWDTEKVHTYPPVKVDAHTQEVFSAPQWDEGPVATKGWMKSLNTEVDDLSWQKLGIDPWVDIPMMHNSAEYYADTSERYFHKYRIIRGDKVEYTDWQEVKEDAFASVEDFLGMDLESKPAGFFASEQIGVPAPEGMSYVGNPVYGNWKTESDGSRFWEFYGQYAMMRDLLGGHRYSYSEWDDWNRNFRGKKPYYGEGDDERYGSGGSVTSAHRTYSGSNYYKTEGRPDSARGSSLGGGAGTQRGSGAAFRAGGPGGGGK